MINVKPFISSIFLVSFTATSIAAETYPLQFEELDTDVNTFISKEEAAVREDLVKNFKKIDKDGDGQLTLSEYQAYEGKERFEPPEDTETPELGAAPAE